MEDEEHESATCQACAHASLPGYDACPLADIVVEDTTSSYNPFSYDSGE